MTSLNKSAVDLMVQYARYHRDRRNILTHLVGIPLIVLAVFMFLTQPLGGVLGMPVSGAWLLWALAALWYLTRGQRLLGAATVLGSGLLCALAHALAWGWMGALALFVLGWIIQFVGHYWEGKKPAFVDDLVGLLVGPMFVVGELLMASGALAELRQAIQSQAGPTR